MIKNTKNSKPPTLEFQIDEAIPEESKSIDSNGFQ